VAQRLLGVALLIVCLGLLTACGGGEEVAKGRSNDGSTTTTTKTEPPTGSTASTSTPDDDDDGGPGNPTFRKGKLKEGHCAEVKAQTEEVLQQSSDAAAVAEARLYHGLATALCGGDPAAAQKDIESVDAALLSPESQQVLEQVAEKGVPRSTTEFREVLRAKAVAPATGGASP
jgi:hypothetical protein